MSCQLVDVTYIKNPRNLISWLCPHLEEPLNTSKNAEIVPWETWDDDDEDDDAKNISDTKLEGNIPWLEECHIALSPFVDLMVIGCKNRLAFLINHLERNEHEDSREVFCVNWKGTVGHHEQDEIAAVICLPIMSQKQSSSGAPDWTCIAVGFRSGYISFYTEILEERPIQRLFCRTYTPKNFGACVFSDLSEEFLILYPKVVVSVDGFSLMQTLKACRNQLAKAAATGDVCSDTLTSLSYKKWSLSEHEKVHDCVASGMLPPHLYDQLMYLSCSQGFNQTISSGIPPTMQLLTTGKFPFLGILGIKEDYVQPYVADIAMHYASKIKDTLVNVTTSWLFGSKPANQSGSKKERPKIEQAVEAPFRYTIPDRRRVGLSISLSLSRRFAAVTDDFGRVTVTDVQKSIVVRMLKGYRDAQCGWLTVQGEWQNRWREVPFLVIFAPRRRILEVWMPLQGARVAAFNVTKNARLVYNSHTILGANMKKEGIANTISCVIINQDGCLQRISMPFHLALSGKTSKQCKDIHLLKTLKLSLRNDSPDQVLKIISEIQTTAIKLQVLSLVVSSRYITENLADGLLTTFLPFFPKENASELKDNEYGSCQTDHEGQLLDQYLRRLRQLLQFYRLLSKLHSNTPLQQPVKEELEMKLSHHLMMNGEELSSVLSKLHDEKLHCSKTKVTFKEDNYLNFSSFLHCWEVCFGGVDKGATCLVSVQLSRKLSEEMEKRLASFLFGWPFQFGLVEQVSKIFTTSGIDFVKLLHLAFVYWMNMDHIDEMDTLHMSLIIFILSVLMQPQVVHSPTIINPYFEKQREELIHWNLPLHAFVAALICKGVEAATLMYGRDIASELSLRGDMDEIDNESYSSLLLNKLYVKLHEPSLRSCNMSDEKFEGLSLEMVEWNLILDKEKQLLTIQKLFNVVRGGGGKITPEFSVHILLTKGKGYVSELVAKWLIQLGIPVKKLAELVEASEEGKEEKRAPDEEAGANAEMMEVNLSQKDETLETVRSSLYDMSVDFPESMKIDVVLLNVAWEYGSVWKKNPSAVDNLRMAVDTLHFIKSSLFKHGLGSMMWETWLVGRVQVATQLIDKFRKVPKERISLKEIGIPEHKLHEFFLATKELLEIIIAGSLACEVERPPIISKDRFWSDTESSPSLAEVAMGQKMVNSDLVFLHHQLLCVLCLLVQYSVRNVRLLGLFPERDRAALFKPLFSAWKATSEEAREVVNGSQLTFLTRVISAAVVALPDSSTESEVSTPSGLYDCVELGRTWGVSVDNLRRYYVCELYSSGLDTMAEQALIMIRDGVVMASQMIVIAGQRLQYLVTSSKKSIQVTALITPQTKEWCKTLDSDCLRSPDQPAEVTLKLIHKAMNLLTEGSPQYKLALNLSRAFTMITTSGILKES